MSTSPETLESAAPPLSLSDGSAHPTALQTPEEASNIRRLLFGDEFDSNGHAETVVKTPPSSLPAEITTPSKPSPPQWGTEPVNARTSQPLSWEAGMVAQRAAAASAKSKTVPSSTTVKGAEQRVYTLDRLRIARPVRWLAVMATTAAMGIGGSVGLSQQFKEVNKAPAAIAAEPTSPSQGQSQGYK